MSVKSSKKQEWVLHREPVHRPPLTPHPPIACPLTLARASLGEAIITKDAPETPVTKDPSNLPRCYYRTLGGGGANFREMEDSVPRRQVCMMEGWLDGGGYRMRAAGAREQAKLLEETDKVKGTLRPIGSGIVCTP